MSKLTKAELKQAVVEGLGCTGTRAGELVDALFQEMAESIINGRRIEIRGFGSLEVKKANPRRARNPSTGEKLFLPARRKVRFRPGKDIKNELAKPL